METEVLTRALKASISEVLEKMFFMPLEFFEAESLSDLWNEKGDQIAVCKLAYRGPFSGYFVFFIPMAVARGMAADFLGNDEKEVLPEHVQDTVKEITNMIAGNTFSIFDTNSIFDLGLPEMVSFDTAGKNQTASDQRVSVGIKTLDNRLAVQLVSRS